MPLETATYISDLVTSNPAASDPLANADDHMRLVKATVKATFPNITGPVTATQADINTLTGGVVKLAGAGTFFNVNTTDGFKNTVAGDIDVQLQGVIAATFQRTLGVNFLKVQGQLEATTIKGAGMCPIGAIVIWPSDTLPPSDEGVFYWCNGTAISRTAYATCYARIGTVHGAGDGSTTFNLPNYQEVTLVGKSTMGGATSPGLLASVSSGLKAVLNGLFGADTRTLARSDLPNVAPTFTGTAGTVNVSGSFSAPTITNTFNTGTAPNPCVMASTVGYSVNSSGSFTPAGTVSSINGGVAQTAFATIQPSRTTNFIIRVA